MLALAAPALVSAIDFSSPAANSTVSKGESYKLTWNTVDTDPSTFSVFLVNFVNWPPYYAPLALNVETAAGETEVKVPCNVDASSGYQFNAINGTNVYVIYAQTPKFSLTGDCEDPAPALPTCEAATVTVTATVSTTFISGIPSTVTLPPSSHFTAPGKCPDTIGWGPSGYDRPVTLSHVPRGADAPAPTPPPKNGAWVGKDYGSTRTVYQTVYRDMSEVEEVCHC